MPNLIQNLVFQSQNKPHSPAVYYGNDALDFASLYKLVKQLAQKLRSQGVVPGQTVVLSISNPVLHNALMLALFHEAVVSCSIAKQQSMPNQVDIDLYISDVADAHLDSTAKSARNFISADLSWLKSVNQQSDQIEALQYEADSAICRLILSSGTTGNSKAIPITHAMLEARLLFRNKIDPQLGAEMSLLDVCSSAGLYIALKPLISGMPIVLPWSYENMKLDLGRRSVTNLIASPVQFSELFNHFGASAPWNNTLKSVTSTGSIIGSNLLDSLTRNLCPNVHILYGSAEAGHVTACTAQEMKQYPGNVGYPLPGVSIEIVNEEGIALPAKDIGVIRLKTPYMANYYFEDPEATAECFKDGWFYPGDLGCVDDSGRLFLSGRKNDIINSGGVKINPNTIDQLLLEQTMVKDAASVGVLNTMGIEEIWSAVVLNDGADIDKLKPLLFSKLTPVYRPSRVIEVASIPRNHNGKISRAELQKTLGAIKDQLD